MQQVLKTCSVKKTMPTVRDDHLKRHIPVLLEPVLEGMAPLANSTIIDGTFGAGGYSCAMLDKGANVIALDRDPEAIHAGEQLVKLYYPRLKLIHTEFSNLGEVVSGKVDGVVLDIGVSSMQIDEAGRGFSFQKDGPLDMRMSEQGFSAADVVNTMKTSDLTRIFGLLGEERYASRIAKMITERREKKPFLRTFDLADAIETLVGRKTGDHIHPATRVFQALRIYVNDELGELAKALTVAESVLTTGGRLGVVTFHSLEDRMVKHFFTARSRAVSQSRYLPPAETEKPTFIVNVRGGITADEAELKRNPRARSARLRLGVRTDAPATPIDAALFGLPDLARFNGNRK